MVFRAARWMSGITVALAFGGLSALGACGGDNKPVTYPQAGQDAAGAPVTQGGPDGAQVGVVDGAGSSGLTGAAKAAYDKGWAAWLQGDLPNAQKYFKESGEAAPDAAAPHYSLGVVLERLGDRSGAQQEYRAAFSKNPKHEVSMCAYALSLAGSKGTSEADTFLEDRRAKVKDSSLLTACQAEVKSIQGDHGSAQQLGQDALRMNPDFKPAMVTIARDHYRAGKADLAKYALQAILEGFGDSSPARDKENAEAHLLRGLILREDGSRAVALADFEAAVRRRPDLVEALVNLGAMRLEAGNAREAQPVLESAIRFSPKDALAHLNLGDCYRLQGRVDDAKREFQTALSLDSTLAAVHYDMGLLYLFAPSVPGSTANEQVSTAIKELETYKTMRGVKAHVNDDIDDLLARAKAKQAELKAAAAAKAAPAEPAAPAAPAGDAGGK